MSIQQYLAWKDGVHAEETHMKISRESMIIAAIGLVDLATTLWWVHSYGAGEANPIFNKYLQMGSGWFIAMKVVCLAAPLFLLEWARARRPHFTQWAARVTIAAYLGMYGVGVMRLNPHLLGGHIQASMEIEQSSDLDLTPVSLREWRENHKDISMAAPVRYDEHTANAGI